MYAAITEQKGKWKQLNQNISYTFFVHHKRSCPFPFQQFSTPLWGSGLLLEKKKRCLPVLKATRMLPPTEMPIQMCIPLEILQCRSKPVRFTYGCTTECASEYGFYHLFTAALSTGHWFGICRAVFASVWGNMLQQIRATVDINKCGENAQNGRSCCCMHIFMTH